MYNIRDQWEFKQHCRGNCHKKNLIKRRDTYIEPTRSELLNAVLKKYSMFVMWRFHSQNRKKAKRQIVSIQSEKIKPF